MEVENYSPLAGESPDVAGDPGILYASFAMQILAGQILFPIATLAMLWIGTPSGRQPIFLNFCVCWIIYSVVYCILFYTGEYIGPIPRFETCLIQAATTYASYTLQPLACFALVFHLWLSVHRTLNGSRHSAEISRLQTSLLVALPYVGFFSMMLAALVVGSKAPGKVSRTRRYYYCSIDDTPLRTISSLVPCIILIATIGFEVATAYRLYHWKVHRNLRVGGWLPLQLFFRLAGFTAWAIMAIAVGVIAIFKPTEKFRVLFLASLPLAAFLILGTKPELYRHQQKQTDTVTNATTNSKANSHITSNVVRTQLTSQHHKESVGTLAASQHAVAV